MIWREKRILLIVLGVLFAVNTVFFFTYRVQYQNRLDALEERLASSEATLTNQRATRVRTERQLAAYQQVERDVKQIYEQQWATQGERLTTMIAEVKRLAIASDLNPRTYGFNRTDAKAPPLTETGRAATGTPRSPGYGSGATRREPSLGAVEVGVAFGVSGSYQQARRLINLLELSPQFVIIDGVDLTSREGNNLALNLNLKTLFRDTATPQSGGRRL